MDIQKIEADLRNIKGTLILLFQNIRPDGAFANIPWVEAEVLRNLGEEWKLEQDEMIKKADVHEFKAGYEMWYTPSIDIIEQGRNEAWEAARKLDEMDLGELKEMFEDDPLSDVLGTESIFSHITASDAIKKLNEWEEKKKVKIKTGHWITRDEYCGMHDLKPYLVVGNLLCSECKYGIDSVVKFSYCPNCGAKMV